MPGPLQKAAEEAAKRAESPGKPGMLLSRPPSRAGEQDAPVEKQAVSQASIIAAATRPLYFTLLTVMVIMPVAGFSVAYLVLEKRVKAVRTEAEGGPFADKAPRPTKSRSKPGKEGDKEAELPTKFIIPEVIVNIPRASSRFLRVSLEMNASPEVIFELEKNQGKVKALVSDALVSKRLDELDSPGIRQRLSSEIMVLINSMLRAGQVTDTYFTEFIIQ